jgi:hypothetical protein
MSPFIILILCACISFFGAKSISGKTQIEQEKSGFDFQKVCWSVSKLLALIVICGFLAGTFSSGRLALSAFMVSIATTFIGRAVGIKQAKKSGRK